MKKIIFSISALAVLMNFAACTKEKPTAPAAEQSTVSTQSTTTQPPKNQAKFWSKLWGAIKSVFGFGPVVTFDYKSGYYESTGPEDYQFKCNPGEAVCEFTITAGMVGNTNPEPPGNGCAVMGLNAAGQLTIVIQKTSLTTGTFNALYADGIMTVPGAWVLQPQLRTALGLPVGYTIPAGNYTIQNITLEGQDLLYVTF